MSLKLKPSARQFGGEHRPAMVTSLIVFSEHIHIHVRVPFRGCCPLYGGPKARLCHNALNPSATSSPIHWWQLRDREPSHKPVSPAIAPTCDTRIVYSKQPFPDLYTKFIQRSQPWRRTCPCSASTLSFSLLPTTTLASSQNTTLLPILPRMPATTILAKPIPDPEGPKSIREGTPGEDRQVNKRCDPVRQQDCSLQDRERRHAICRWTRRRERNHAVQRRASAT